MTEAELVVAALTAGATAGLTDTARGAVQDVYAGLREAVRRRLAARGEGSVRVLEAAEAEPGSEERRTRLSELLVAVGADRDKRILAAARSLCTVVDSRGSKGVQIGDHNTQTNTFN